MDWNSPPSITEIIKAVAGLGVALASFKGWRSGALSRLWENAIGVLAAPVERDLARRETKAVNYENARLTRQNEDLQAEVLAMEEEAQRLKSQVVLLLGRSSIGSSTSEDGTQTRQ